MPELSRRRLLTSIAAAPMAEALASSAAAQGVYGAYGAPPPKASPVNGPPARFPPPTPEMLIQTSRMARERIRELHFPDVTLINQDEKEVRFYSDLLKDKVVTLNFFYTQCDRECPTVLANLAKLYKLLGDRMGRQIFMYSITLKPEHDTPKVLKEVARTFHAGPGWMFLTGKEDDIEQVRRGMGFVYKDSVLDKDKSQHIGNICYGSEPLTLWGGSPGMTHPTWLAREISSIIRAGEVNGS